MVGVLVASTFVGIGFIFVDPPVYGWIKGVLVAIALLLWFMAIMWHTHAVTNSVTIRLEGFSRIPFPEKGFQVWQFSLHIRNRPDGKPVGLERVFLLLERDLSKVPVLIKATAGERQRLLKRTVLDHPVIQWILDDWVIVANASLSGSVAFIDLFSLEMSRGVELVIEELSGRKHRLKWSVPGKVSISTVPSSGKG
jgi:hypothetical protein